MDRSTLNREPAIESPRYGSPILIQPDYGRAGARPAGERVRSFAIITTEPNELCAALHNRMPAILAPQAWPEWLGEQPADEA